ncbi:hypothetical protein [Labedaea rhizosphaerae]|uniref:Uncharacterized protein n=1 Tax=Labedaea rhizosphaerae TaxID=598644 RepID=A0A4V3D063_LABRH|nr:hypothetical protein [Labedaea rhizosphaerae]TDQ04475.1 hypothetical protein EV186_101427 [Labedaea rhizosphaerae]
MRAGDHARDVVGLYGDPTVAWSILIRARPTDPIAQSDISQRLAACVRRHPWLGIPPVVEPFDQGIAERFACTPYADGESLVRVAAGDELVIAAHHGAVDGLGLLALLGAALDVPVTSNASGVGRRRGAESFARSALRRLGEAVFAPPTRIEPSARHESDAEVLLHKEIPRVPAGTAALTVAALRATESWNREHGVPANRVVAAVGASRRPGYELRPEHDSAFFRLPLPADADRAEVHTLLRGRAPEPDFPAKRNPVVGLGIRALAPRLGSTFLMSNLGVVSAPVRSLAFYPTASGRSGVAFGAVTTGDTTTVTVRARGRDFDAVSAMNLLELLVSELPDASR